jgi:hypothetical protein
LPTSEDRCPTRALIRQERGRRNRKKMLRCAHSPGTQKQGLGPHALGAAHMDWPPHVFSHLACRLSWLRMRTAESILLLRAGPPLLLAICPTGSVGCTAVKTPKPPALFRWGNDLLPSELPPPALCTSSSRSMRSNARQSDFVHGQRAVADSSSKRRGDHGK